MVKLRQCLYHRNCICTVRSGKSLILPRAFCPTLSPRPTASHTSEPTRSTWHGTPTVQITNGILSILVQTYQHFQSSELTDYIGNLTYIKSQFHFTPDTYFTDQFQFRINWSHSFRFPSVKLWSLMRRLPWLCRCRKMKLMSSTSHGVKRSASLGRGRGADIELLRRTLTRCLLASTQRHAFWYNSITRVLDNELSNLICVIYRVYHTQMWPVYHRIPIVYQPYATRIPHPHVTRIPPYANRIPIVYQSYTTHACDPYTTVYHTNIPPYTTVCHCIPPQLTVYHRMPIVYQPYAIVCHTGCMTDRLSQLKYIQTTSGSSCPGWK